MHLLRFLILCIVVCIHVYMYVCVCLVSMQDWSLRGVMKVLTYPLVIQFLVGIMYCVTVSERRKG